MEYKCGRIFAQHIAELFMWLSGINRALSRGQLVEAMSEMGNGNE